MQVNNLIYLTDDIIYLKNKKRTKIISQKINKNIIKYGKIYNQEKFIKTYDNLLKTNHLNNNIFGDTIKVIINDTYTPADIKYLKSTLEKFNYRKILFEKETKKYKLNTQNAYLNVLTNYSILSYIDEYKKTKSYLIPDDFFPSLKDFLSYIKKIIAERELFLIGHGEKISEILNEFEKTYQNKTYIYTNSATFIIN